MKAGAELTHELLAGNSRAFGEANTVPNVGVDAVCVPGGIKYDVVMRKFGSEVLGSELIHRFEALTGKRPHVLLRRGLFFSHRDLKVLLDDYEAGKPFYLYTGRGPSAAMHLGHLVPFRFTAYLQSVFHVPVVIQLTGDEKYLTKNISLDTCRMLTGENARDIVACGFDPHLTFIFSNLDSMGFLYPTVLQIQKCITVSQVRAIFGIKNEDNIGRASFAAIQAAPSFSTAFPEELLANFTARTVPMRCLIPCGIDQDPYFRLTRDVAPKLGLPKPSLIHSRFLPSLRGVDAKASASDPASAIYLCDSPKEVARKVRGAMSGGRDTRREQELRGANLEVDVPYLYLTALLEDDDEFAELTCKYARGAMMTGEVKSRMAATVNNLLREHCAARASISDATLRLVFTVRTLGGQGAASADATASSTASYCANVECAEYAMECATLCQSCRAVAVAAE